MAPHSENLLNALQCTLKRMDMTGIKKSLKYVAPQLLPIFHLRTSEAGCENGTIAEMGNGGAVCQDGIDTSATGKTWRSCYTGTDVTKEETCVPGTAARDVCKDGSDTLYLYILH
ncbi:MAG: hypothetical protein GY756_01115 [bacterium]|nr:hypothetical protein [bacterium]